MGTQNELKTHVSHYPNDNNNLAVIHRIIALVGAYFEYDGRNVNPGDLADHMKEKCEPLGFKHPMNLLGQMFGGDYDELTEFWITYYDQEGNEYNTTFEYKNHNCKYFLRGSTLDEVSVDP